MVKIDKIQFEQTCLNIVGSVEYNKEKYLHIRKDKIPIHYLRPHLQKIASNYFPHNKNGSKYGFPAELIVLIAVKMNLFVTDIIVFKR